MSEAKFEDPDPTYPSLPESFFEDNNTPLLTILLLKVKVANDLCQPVCTHYYDESPKKANLGPFFLIIKATNLKSMSYLGHPLNNYITLNPLSQYIGSHF